MDSFKVISFLSSQFAFSARGLRGEVINVLRLDQGSPLLDPGPEDPLPVAILDSGPVECAFSAFTHSL